jgi:hypothetical protein
MTDQATIQSNPPIETPREPQTRAPDGKFGSKPADPLVNPGIGAVQESTRSIVQDALRESFGGGKRLPDESDKKALDGVKPKGKDAEAKTDPAEKDSATAKAKPEPTSKDATRQLTKARKALELEGWSEDDIADLSEERTLSIGTKYQEKHAKADREKREAAEAAKKAPKADPGTKPSATDSESEEGDDDLSDYVKAADEHFKGFEAETEEGTKAFRTAQAKFVKQAVDRVSARYEARIGDLERGIRGESALNRALDRIANDIPQVDEPDVRQKLVNRIAALASDPDTAEELRSDMRAVVRREAVALGLKDEAAARKKAADEELRAAKDAGQPFTGHRGAEPERELSGVALIRDELRKAYSAPR